MENTTDATFDAVLASSHQMPVLIDFWAPWCGPCRAMEPVLTKLAAEFDSSVRFVKLNTDDNPGTSARYGITGVPTLLILVNGEVRATSVGALPPAKLRAFIENAIAA